MANKINLFVSHYGGDEKYIEKFKQLISHEYDTRDGSVVKSDPNNAHNPEYIKSIIRSQIDWAGKIVVLIGPETHNRDWVDWELEYAGTHGDKRIVGVYIPGATDADLPDALKDYGSACVTWNTQKIRAALEGANIWEDSSGALRPDHMNRSTC
jgi:hypothetical protein